MKKIFWIINRAKAMSNEEKVYRVTKIIKKYIYNYRFKRNVKVYEIDNLNINIDDLINMLNKIFNNITTYNISYSNEYYFMNTIIDIEKNIEWHKSNKSSWENNINSNSIEFKDRNNIGDVRYSWEINRHHFMPYLASCYIKTKNEKYLDLIQFQFENWIKSNYFLKGINWSSSMEIALRAYQWLIVLFIIKDTDRKDLKRKLTNSIYYSISYVMDNLSLYSSANNHLIIEAAISSIIGYCFKESYSQHWFEKGYEILKSEIPKQFNTDGVNKEQALHYQAFVTDIMLQYNSIMKKLKKNPISPEVIEKSVEFISRLDSDQIHFDFGDSDDAKIINLSNKDINYYNYILNFASLYYNKRFTENVKIYDEISLFLSACKINNKISKQDLTIFREGGYGLFKVLNSILLFDFAELGFGTLAAHGHSDALMFLYSYKSIPFFIDSGTYIYNIERDKRDYYRSSVAHNTLSYKGYNQSEIKGPFLWGKKANSKLNLYSDTIEKYIIEAEHDGYFPSIHKRRIEYIKTKNVFIIYDYFDKQAELNFILDPMIKIKKIDEKLLKLVGKETIYIYLEGKIQIEKIKVSKHFLSEIDSYKIKVIYNFRQKHVTLISPELNKIKEILKSEMSKNENS